MITQTEQIIEEYVFWPTDTECTIKGRVSKIITPEDRHGYTWAISHHYRPTKEAAGVYYPSVITAEPLEEAKHHLFDYANGCSGIDLTPNTYY